MEKEKNDGYDGILACESISLSASNRASNWNPLESYDTMDFYPISIPPGTCHSSVCTA